MTPGQAARYVRSDAVLSRDVESALLLLAPGRSGVVALSGSGPVIWSLLRTPTSFDDLVAELVQRFSLPADDIADDVRRTLEELLAAHVLRRNAA